MVESNDPSSSPPQLPVRPTLGRPERKRPIATVLLALLVAVLLFAGLTLLTLGWFGPVLFIAAGVFAFAAFHYFVWGYWLSKAVRRREEKRTHEEGESSSVP